MPPRFVRKVQNWRPASHTNLQTRQQDNIYIQHTVVDATWIGFYTIILGSCGGHLGKYNYWIVLY